MLYVWCTVFLQKVRENVIKKIIKKRYTFTVLYLLKKIATSKGSCAVQTCIVPGTTVVAN